MFSTMITVESTTMPKSTAPSEIRLAGVPVVTMPMNAIMQRQRNVDRGDERGARVAEEQPQHHRHQQHADEQVLDDRVRGQLHQRRAIVVGLDVHARRQEAILADVLDALVHAFDASSASRRRSA